MDHNLIPCRQIPAQGPVLYSRYIEEFFAGRNTENQKRAYYGKASYWEAKQMYFPEILNKKEFENDLSALIYEANQNQNQTKNERAARYKKRDIIRNWIPSFIEFRENEILKLKTTINELEILVVEINLSSQFVHISEEPNRVCGLLDTKMIVTGRLTCHPTMIRKDKISLVNASRKKMPYFRSYFEIQLHEPLVCHLPEIIRGPRWSGRSCAELCTRLEKKNIFQIDDPKPFLVQTLNVWNHRQLFSTYARCTTKDNIVMSDVFHASILLQDSNHLASLLRMENVPFAKEVWKIICLYQL